MCFVMAHVNADVMCSPLINISSFFVVDVESLSPVSPPSFGACFFSACVLAISAGGFVMII